MDIQRVSGQNEVYSGQSKHLTGKSDEGTKSAQVHDSVSLTGKGDDPKIMVGARTGDLSPQLFNPRHYTTPVGIEITNGIGISLDGESIIVGHGKEGEIEIKGRLEDGTAPQRDFNIKREGNKTLIDGFHDWQDRTITNEGSKTVIKGEEPIHSFEIENKGSSTIVSGQYPVQNYVITQKGKEVYVDGFTDPELGIDDDIRLTTEGNVTKIDGGFESNNFTVTRGENKMHIDGHYAFQDFDISWNDKGITIKGFYPHQKYQINFKNPA